eukprot:352473-Chlamydomonas_euryale.AAC.1
MSWSPCPDSSNKRGQQLRVAGNPHKKAALKTATGMKPAAGWQQQSKQIKSSGSSREEAARLHTFAQVAKRRLPEYKVTVETQLQGRSSPHRLRAHNRMAGGRSGLLRRRPAGRVWTSHTSGAGAPGMHGKTTCTGQRCERHSAGCLVCHTLSDTSHPAARGKPGQQQRASPDSGQRQALTAAKLSFEVWAVLLWRHTRPEGSFYLSGHSNFKPQTSTFAPRNFSYPLLPGPTGAPPLTPPSDPPSRAQPSHVPSNHEACDAANLWHSLLVARPQSCWAVAPTPLGSRTPHRWGHILHTAGSTYSTPLGSHTPHRWEHICPAAGSTRPTCARMKTARTTRAWSVPIDLNAKSAANAPHSSGPSIDSAPRSADARTVPASTAPRADTSPRAASDAAAWELRSAPCVRYGEGRG